MKGRRNVPHTQTGNWLLDSLPDDEFERLRPELTVTPLPLGETICETGENIAGLYFPTAGAVAILAVGQDGNSAAVNLVGREGVAGICGLYGRATSPWTMRVELPGEAVYVTREAIREHAIRNRTADAILRQYMGSMLGSLAESNTCNRFHHLEARCARWLLITRDRAASEEFPMTQRLLAEMLGVHRPSLATVLGELETRGLIERSGVGAIRIVDSAGLEAVACDLRATILR